MSNSYNAALMDDRNIRVMRKAISAFGRAIPSESRGEIMQGAVSRCLKRYDPSYGQTFTTSLFRYTRWECQNFLRNTRRASGCSLSLREMNDIEAEGPHDRQADIDHIYECMEMISERDRSIVQQYYLLSMTLEEIGRENGYTREAARQKLGAAMERLRKVCLKDE